MSLLTAVELDASLRPAYHQGDTTVSVEFMLDNLMLGEHRICVKRDFDTACWIPPVGSRGSHGIYYGDRMLGRVFEFFQQRHRRPPTEAELAKAVQAYGRHERWHALETPRDLNVVVAQLKALRLVFSTFNLFEDARIEAIARRRQGSRFDWVAFEALAPLEGGKAWNLFLRCIQLEGDVDTEAQADGVHGARALRVFHYYQRACLCACAEDLYPIMREFMDEFAETPPEQSKGGSGKGTGAEIRADDLQTAAEAASRGDAFLAEFDADARIYGGEGKDAKAKVARPVKGTPQQGEEGSIQPTASGGRGTEADFLSTHEHPVDPKRVAGLVSKLMRLFKTHSLAAYTEQDGHRLSARHLARGDLRFVHKKVFGGKGKRKYDVVFDCSGSMSAMRGQPAAEGRIFLMALNQLARLGHLDGSLILSGYVGRRPGWLKYKLPVADSIIRRIHPDHGGEGLQNALADNLKDIKGKDDVFVYTDARITDAPLDRALFAQHHVWPVGLYVGPAENATSMDTHFPQNIIRDTIEQVVEAMLIRNKRTLS